MDRIRVIYAGGMTRDLGICDDPASVYFGWLFARHPDGQWVTLVKVIDEIRALAARNGGGE